MVQSESIPFVPGLELSRALYEATAPILARHFPDLAYGAGRCAKSIAPQGSVSRSAPPGGWCSALYQSAGFLQVVARRLAAIPCSGSSFCSGGRP